MKSIFSILSIIFLFHLNSLAGIDSLKNMLLQHSAKDSLKVDILNQIGYEYWIIDPANSEEYGLKALQLAEKINYPSGLAFANRVVGVSHWARGSYEYALAFLLDGLTTYKKIQDTLGIANCTMNIGLVYQDQLNNTRALDYFFEAIELFEMIDRQDRIATTYNKIGTIYIQQNKFEDAYNYLFQALSIHTKNDFTYGIAESHNRLGLLNEQDQKLDEALTHFNTSYELGQSIKDYYGMAQNLAEIGKIHLIRQEYQKAEMTLQNAIQIAHQASSNKWLRDIYHTLKNLYRQLGDFQRSLEYYDKYVAMKDSLFNEELATKISNLELKNQQEAQEKALELKKQEILLLEQQARFDQLMQYILIAGILISLVMAYLIWSQQRLKIRKRNDLIQKSRELYHSRQKLAKVEIENAKLKEHELQKELDFKNKELTSYALNFVQKNEIFQDLKQSIQDLKKKPAISIDKKVQDLDRMINQSLHIDKDWEDFKLYFEQVHKNFFNLLKENCPNLSSSELKLCALIRLNLNMKESAAILGISPESVKTARYRIRRKLDLEREASILDYLIKLENAKMI